MAFVALFNLYVGTLDGGFVPDEIVPPTTHYTCCPAVAPDGRFIFLRAGVNGTAVADGGFNGDWLYPIYGSASSNEELPGVSGPLISPRGTIFVSTSLSALHALNMSTGQPRWSRPIGHVEKDGRRFPLPLGIGVGDAVLGAGRGFIEDGGTAFLGTTIDGGEATPYAATRDRIIAGYYADLGSHYLLRSFVFDECMQLAWELPNSGPFSWGVALVGFDDRLLVLNGPDAYWYSREGEVITGPKLLNGRPVALGADDVVYTIDCVPTLDGGSTDQVLVRAYDSALEEQWSFRIASSCEDAGQLDAALGPNGILYVANGSASAHEVIGVQTQSPGEARTAWPGPLGGARRTRWAGE